MAQRGVLPEDERKSISIDFCAVCKTIPLNQNKKDVFTLFLLYCESERAVGVTISPRKWRGPRDINCCGNDTQSRRSEDVSPPSKEVRAR